MKFLFAVLLFLSIARSGSGQVNKIFVQGEYINVSLIDFLSDVEKKNVIKFHYLNDVVKDIRVTAEFRNKTNILTALEILLVNEPISCMDNGEGGIVLFANENKVLRKTIHYSTISGRIANDRGEGVPFATVVLLGPGKGSMTNEDGIFSIRLVEHGQYLLKCSSVGYESFVLKVNVNSDISLNITLRENAHELEEIVISPSTFEISTVEATPLTLGKEEILHSPNLGKDIYRTLRALPGIANNDYSAKARIRGGHSDESAVYLDNFLINDASHLEEVDGSFSIFNTDYIDELKVLTGGFNAKYTDRLSGVIDVRTFDRLESDQYKFSIDLLNASFLAQKRINDKLSLFFNARRGYLDFLLDNMGDDTDVLVPRFADMWTKVLYKPNPRNTVSCNFLFGRDNFLLQEEPLGLENKKNNINGWVNWKWFPSERFDAITTFGFQATSRNALFTFPENITINNIDKNSTDTWVLTNNSYYHLDRKSDIEFGAEVKYYSSNYQYWENRYAVFNSIPENIVTESLDINNWMSGYTASLFAQYNGRFWDKISLQPGLRVSTQSFSQPLKVAPRFALSYDITPSLTTRLSYGIYYQPDTYYRLRSSQFQEEPYDYNSKAGHYTGSLTFSRHNFNVMLNAYHKEYSRLFDDYRYEFFNRIGAVSILDIPFQTTSGYSQGAEIIVRYNYGKASLLSVSYAYAKSRIRNSSGEETFRDFDQPHTIILNNIFRLPNHWNISLFWTYHTGYPYTPTKVDFVKYRPEPESVVLFYEAGFKNSQRLPHYRSLDIRVEKTWFLGKNQLTAYINFINVFNRSNIRSYWWSSYKLSNGSIAFTREAQTNIPSFVSPGLSFTLF